MSSHSKSLPYNQATVNKQLVVVESFVHKMLNFRQWSRNAIFLCCLLYSTVPYNIQNRIRIQVPLRHNHLIKLKVQNDLDIPEFWQNQPPMRKILTLKNQALSNHVSIHKRTVGHKLQNHIIIFYTRWCSVLANIAICNFRRMLNVWKIFGNFQSAVKNWPLWKNVPCEPPCCTVSTLRQLLCSLNSSCCLGDSLWCFPWIMNAIDVSEWVINVCVKYVMKYAWVCIVGNCADFLVFDFFSVDAGVQYVQVQIHPSQENN